MENILLKSGFLLILIGFLLIFIGVILSAKNENVKFGFGGFIGPIPFGFANDPNILVLVLLVSLIILVFFFLSIKQI